MKDAFVELLMKYFAKLPKESVVSDAVAIMTDEDYAEYERLLKVVIAADGCVHGGGVRVSAGRGRGVVK